MRRVGCVASAGAAEEAERMIEPAATIEFPGAGIRAVRTVGLVYAYAGPSPVVGIVEHACERAGEFRFAFVERMQPGDLGTCPLHGKVGLIVSHAAPVWANVRLHLQHRIRYRSCWMPTVIYLARNGENSGEHEGPQLDGRRESSLRMAMSQPVKHPSQAIKHSRS